MNRNFLLIVLVYVCFTSASRAQQANGNSEQDTPAIYVLDGERTSFAYGRVTAFNKIAIGLTDEGVYVLRGDTAVWLVNHPARQDELVCRINNDFMTGNKLFVMVMPDARMTPVDTVCAFNPAAYMIFDKAGNVAGTIKSDGTLVSPQGKTLLLNLQSVDKLLAAFFFAYHYTPVRKQLKFSSINMIRNSYSNRYAS
jgi:hypothetical protein